MIGSKSGIFRSIYKYVLLLCIQNFLSMTVSLLIPTRKCIKMSPFSLTDRICHLNFVVVVVVVVLF